jgi:hypothetical protein
VRLTGPAVAPGRLAARDLAELARRLDQALRRIGRVLYGEGSRARGRSARDIEELCRLYLVSWGAGSAVAGFDLPEPPPQLPLFGHIGEDSLDALLAGLVQLSAPQPRPGLPDGFDTGVLQACEALGHLLDRGIDRIDFKAGSRQGDFATTYSAPTRERIRELIERPQETGEVVKTGRLEVLNGHHGLAGALWGPDGSRWLCRFKPEHVESLPEAWLKTVTVRGTIAGDAGVIDVVAISSRDGGSGADEAGRDAAGFWKAASLDELIAIQAVSPVTDLSEFDAIWSEGDAFDDALSELLEDRAQRRRVRKTRTR